MNQRFEWAKEDDEVQDRSAPAPSKVVEERFGLRSARQSFFPSATSPRSVTKSSSDPVAPLDQQVILARGDSLYNPGFLGNLV
jgi:hypothetical protein